VWRWPKQPGLKLVLFWEGPDVFDELLENRSMDDVAARQSAAIIGRSQPSSTRLQRQERNTSRRDDGVNNAVRRSRKTNLDNEPRYCDRAWTISLGSDAQDLDLGSSLRLRSIHEGRLMPVV
jgi:hypothetical protein